MNVKSPPSSMSLKKLRSHDSYQPKLMLLRSLFSCYGSTSNSSNEFIIYEAPNRWHRKLDFIFSFGKCQSLFFMKDNNRSAFFRDLIPLFFSNWSAIFFIKIFIKCRNFCDIRFITCFKHQTSKTKHTKYVFIFIINKV